MKLSIIIVNYNVKNFLQLLLKSIFKSSTNFEFEVIVVDNHSTDDSVAMLKKLYPSSIQLIANKENLGFSKANNIGIKNSIGQYTLLLNPDTIIMEDTLQKMVDFLDSHADAGALGVKMIDGEGKFLPESKRGLPTPIVSLYKIIGLNKLFPKSKTFGHYHLGYLDKSETHQVEVLSGACMMMSKEALVKVGMLDEDYFMYGEDIDLSFQIQKLGLKNYYFPQTKIIHFKGESTQKEKLKYLLAFYESMHIFFKKNFSDDANKLSIYIIRLAIVSSTFIAGLYRITEKFGDKIWSSFNSLKTKAAMLFGVKWLSPNINYLIVGDEESICRVNTYFEKNDKYKFVGFIASQKSLSKYYLGNYDKIADIILKYGIQEVIFTTEKTSFKDIIEIMSQLSGKVKFGIAPDGMNVILGSNSKNTLGHQRPL